MPNPPTIDAAGPAVEEESQIKPDQAPQGPPVPQKPRTIRMRVGFVVDGNQIIIHDVPAKVRARSKVVIRGYHLNIYNQVLLRAGINWYRPIDLRRAYGDNEPISFLVPNFNKILRDGDAIWIRLVSKSSPRATGVIVPYSQYSTKTEEEEKKAEEEAEKAAQGGEATRGAGGAAPGPTAIALGAAGEVIGGIAKAFAPGKAEEQKFAPQQVSPISTVTPSQKVAIEEEYGDEGEYSIAEEAEVAEIEAAAPLTSTAQISTGAATVSEGTTGVQATISQGGTVTGKETLGVSGTVTGREAATVSGTVTGKETLGVSGTATVQVGGATSGTISGTTQVGGAVSGGVSGTVTGKESVSIGGGTAKAAAAGFRAVSGGTALTGMAISGGGTVGATRPAMAAAEVTGEAGQAVQAQAAFKPLSGEQRQTLIDQSLETIDSNFDRVVRGHTAANPHLTEEQLREVIKGHGTGDVGIVGREPVKRLVAALQQIDGQSWGLKDAEIDWAIRKITWGQLRRALIDAELGGEKIGDVIKRVLESNPLPGGVMEEGSKVATAQPPEEEVQVPPTSPVPPTKTEEAKAEEKVEVPPEIAVQIAKLKEGNLPSKLGAAVPGLEGEGAPSAPAKVAPPPLTPTALQEGLAGIKVVLSPKEEGQVPIGGQPAVPARPETGVPAGTPKEAPSGPLRPARFAPTEKPAEEGLPLEAQPPETRPLIQPPSVPTEKPAGPALGAGAEEPGGLGEGGGIPAAPGGPTAAGVAPRQRPREILDQLKGIAGGKAAGKATSKVWYYGLSSSAAVWFSGLDFFVGALVMDAYWIFGHKKDKDLFPLKAWQKAVTVFANIAPFLYAAIIFVLILFMGCNYPIGKVAGSYKGSVLGALGYGEYCEALNNVGSGMRGAFSSTESPPYPPGPCAPLFSGPASVDNLTQTCFDGNAVKASAIAGAESGGVQTLASGVDKCQPGGEAVSWGLFQINISAHKIGGLNCPTAFDKMYTGTNHQCQVVNQSLYNSCVQAAQDASSNIQLACLISQDGANWSAWGANKKCGF